MNGKKLLPFCKGKEPFAYKCTYEHNSKYCAEHGGNGYAAAAPGTLLKAIAAKDGKPGLLCGIGACGKRGLIIIK